MTLPGARGLAAVLAVGVLAGGCGGAGRPGRGGGAAAGGATRTVVDMRGVSVAVPRTPARVATIDDGFVEGVMTRLGAIRTLVAVGSSSQQRVWSYSYPSDTGSIPPVSEGMGTMRALHPWIADLPCASRTTGDAVNYETLAAARPDVVIARVGDCTVGRRPETVARMAAVFDALTIPLVVLRSPTDFTGQGTETLHAEIELLGSVFGRENDARELSRELAAAEAAVRSRVADVPIGERPRALYLGLAAGARTSGGAAYAWGTATAESWMLEELAGARNAYRGPGSRVLLNAEQILALDPDLVFLPTSNGYHPAEELAQAPYFRELRALRAVRERRVYPLPWSPMNCARRLEYPIDLMIMAKGCHPERFRDVAVHAWVLDFYRRTYGVDDERAAALRRAQWLEWTVDSGF